MSLKQDTGQQVIKMNTDSGSEYVRSEDEGNAGGQIHISDNQA